MEDLEAAMQAEIHGQVQPGPPVMAAEGLRPSVQNLGVPAVADPAARNRGTSKKVDEQIQKKRVTKFLDQNRNERMDDVEDDFMGEYYRRNYGKTTLKRHIYEREQEHV